MAGQDERRRLPRRRTRLSVAVVFDEPPVVVRATIKDISDLGARLLLDESTPIPDAFDVIELTAGRLRECRIVWRAEPFVGVAFDRTIALKGVQEPRLMKRAALWIRLLGR